MELVAAKSTRRPLRETHSETDKLRRHFRKLCVTKGTKIGRVKTLDVGQII